MISPHGGKLINRIVLGGEREELLKKSSAFPKVHLTEREISDLEMIAIGALSPLEGFMGQKDYISVLKNRRLSNGPVWTIPITLAVTNEEAKDLKEGSEISLVDEKNSILAVLKLEEKYTYNKEEEAKAVYLTTDQTHPGVEYLYSQAEVLLAGKISLINRPAHTDFVKYRLDPVDTRRIFQEKNWRRIVGFQTRNPIHRAHEYIQKCAMEIVDGLLLHPIVGATKSDDISAEVRMRCYEVLLENYYPKDRAVLAVNPAAMRYAGPREAIFHAIVRKNYGCTHFIVGRDHAGVGNYYGTFDAHYIFDEFKPEELEITPLFFDHTFYCRRCEDMGSIKTCPHDKSEHISLSGTQVRKMLAEGQIPPKEFSRPEVAKVLIEAFKK